MNEYVGTPCYKDNSNYILKPCGRSTKSDKIDHKTETDRQTTT